MEPFQIGSDNTNMIRSVCNHCKKELKCSGTGTTSSTIRFDSKFQIIAQLFDSKWKKNYSHRTTELKYFT